MFQKALIESDSTAKPRSSLGIPLAVLIHALGLGGIIGLSAWTTDEPPEPSGPLVFRVWTGPPAAAGTAAPRAGPARREGRAAPSVRRFESPAFTPDLAVDPGLPPGADPPGAEGVPDGVEGGTGEQSGGPEGDVVGRPAPKEVETFRPGGDIAAPALLRRVEPTYPEAARKAQMEGLVLLEAIINAAGSVEEVRVIRSANPLLDQAAVDAVTQWRYRPATLNGRAVRVFLTVTVSFKLH